MSTWEGVVIYLVLVLLACLYASTEPPWAVWVFRQIVRPIRWIERKVRK